MTTRLFILKPEVAGGLGDSTVVLNYEELRSGLAIVPAVSILEYEFEDWLGDEIVETFPCFIVTAVLAEKIQNANLSGASFDEVKVSKSDLFIGTHDMDLPPFVRLIPTGHVRIDGTTLESWTGEDFSMAQRAELVVTERALAVLRTHRLAHCSITPLQ